MGEDGHAFVLSPDGLQVFLEQDGVAPPASGGVSSQPGQTVPGGVEESGSSAGESGTITVRSVAEEEKPTKVRFAEPLAEEREDEVSRKEGEGGASKGNPF